MCGPRVPTTHNSSVVPENVGTRQRCALNACAHAVLLIALSTQCDPIESYVICQPSHTVCGAGAAMRLPLPSSPLWLPSTPQ
jgi:hypothetical protein